MNEAMTQQIQNEVAGSRVHVYMKGTPEWPQCGFSKAVCDVFRAVGAQFTATNVLTDLDSYRAALGSITQWPTIPQVFINGEFVGGCDILIEMYHRGELQQMLAPSEGEVEAAPATTEPGH